MEFIHCLHLDVSSLVDTGWKKGDAIQMTRTQKSKRESGAQNISSLKIVDRPRLLRTQQKSHGPQPRPDPAKEINILKNSCEALSCFY